MISKKRVFIIIVLILLLSSSLLIMEDIKKPSYKEYQIGGDKFFISTNFGDGRFGAGLAEPNQKIEIILDENTLQFPTQEIENSKQLFFYIIPKPENFDSKIQKFSENIEEKTIHDCQNINGNSELCSLLVKVENIPIKLYGDKVYLLRDKNSKRINNVIACQTKYSNLRSLCDSTSSISPHALLVYEFDQDLLSRLNFIDEYLKGLAQNFKNKE